MARICFPRLCSVQPDQDSFRHNRVLLCADAVLPFPGAPCQSSPATDLASLSSAGLEHPWSMGALVPCPRHAVTPSGLLGPPITGAQFCCAIGVVRICHRALNTCIGSSGAWAGANANSPPVQRLSRLPRRRVDRDTPPFALHCLISLASIVVPLAGGFLGISALAILKLLLSAVPGRQTPIWRASAFVTSGSRCSCLIIPLCHSARLEDNFESALSWKPWRDRKGRLGRFVPSQRVARARQVGVCRLLYLLFGFSSLPTSAWAAPKQLAPFIEASQRITALCPEQLEVGTRPEAATPDDPAPEHPTVTEDGPSWREIVAQVQNDMLLEAYGEALPLPSLRFVVMEPGFLPVHIALSSPPATQVDVIAELSASYGNQQGEECPPLVAADPQPCDGAWLMCSLFPEYVWSPVEYTDLQRFAEPYGRFWEVFTRGDTAPVAPQTRQQVTCGQTFQFRPSGCPPLANRRAWTRCATDAPGPAVAQEWLVVSEDRCHTVWHAAHDDVDLRSRLARDMYCEEHGVTFSQPDPGHILCDIVHCGRQVHGVIAATARPDSARPGIDLGAHVFLPVFWHPIVSLSIFTLTCRFPVRRLMPLELYSCTWSISHCHMPMHLHRYGPSHATTAKPSLSTRLGRLLLVWLLLHWICASTLLARLVP